jgi:cytochrome c oxidase subunit IV
MKYSFICYALITLGQLWLYSLNSRTEGLYERVTNNSFEWIGSHIVLLIGAFLIFAATLALKSYLKDSSKYLVYTAITLTFLGTLSLIGQFILDFYLISLFKGQTSKTAYEALEIIHSNGFVKFFCYDLIAAWLLGQILFIIALFRNQNYPKWALVLFILGLTMLILGNSLHELIERLSYFVFSIALWPIFNKNYQSITQQ